MSLIRYTCSTFPWKPHSAARSGERGKALRQQPVRHFSAILDIPPSGLPSLVGWLRKKPRQRSLEREIAFKQMEDLEGNLHHDELVQQVIRYFSFFRELGKPPHGFMKDRFGFTLHRRQSNVSGLGIFLDGHVTRGTVVGFYPGTIYFPGDSLLVASLFNNYLLRRPDGISVDGNVKGVGPMIYLSCAGRELAYHSDFPMSKEDAQSFGRGIVDISWLKEKSLETMQNPLAQGNYVNHSDTPNVCYIAFDFPADFPPSLRGFIPNVFYSHRTPILQNEPFVNSTAVVALRDIADEELFGHYCFIGKTVS